MMWVRRLFASKIKIWFIAQRKPVICSILLWFFFDSHVVLTLTLSRLDNVSVGWLIKPLLRRYKQLSSVTLPDSSRYFALLSGTTVLSFNASLHLHLPHRNYLLYRMHPYVLFRVPQEALSKDSCLSTCRAIFFTSRFCFIVFFTRQWNSLGGLTTSPEVFSR